MSHNAGLTLSPQIVSYALRAPAHVAIPYATARPLRGHCARGYHPELRVVSPLSVIGHALTSKIS